MNRYLTNSLLATAALALSACSGGSTTGPFAPIASIAAPGIYSGSLVDDQTGTTREAYAMVAPEGGRFMLVAFDQGQDQDNEAPANVVYGLLEDDGNNYDAFGEAYPSVLPRVFRSNGIVADRDSMNGAYAISVGGDITDSGDLRLDYDDAYDNAFSIADTAGTYENDELSLTITELGLVFASGSAGSQVGNCGAITGLLYAPVDGVNALQGNIELDTQADPDCKTGSSNPALDNFAALAYLVDTNACADSTGSPNTLVLGMGNGITAHYFHRLCLAN